MGEATVRTRVAATLGKLDPRNRMQAVVRARELGVVREACSDEA